MEELINFKKPKLAQSIIMVVGVGGGGGNAVNHMYDLGIQDVSFMICNTDKQALESSPIPIKIHLGQNLTEGLGAGDNPERGSMAARESIDAIKEVFIKEGTKMVFITAGMGGGTGTGGAPVIAQAAQEMGILTVAIVTLPFRTEGRRRANQALKGVAALQEHTDSLLLVNNESIREMYGDLPITEAFGCADNILASAAKGISEIITRTHHINVDFADVRTVMTRSGVALMGSARADGPERVKAVSSAVLASPLLNHNDIRGAKNILINISYGDREITMDEACEIIDMIQDRSGNDANLIWGSGKNEALTDEVELTIVATGFEVTAISQLEQKPQAGGSVPPFSDGKPIIGEIVPSGAAADIESEMPMPESDNLASSEEADQYLMALDKEMVKYRDTPAYLRRRIRMAPVPKNSVAPSKMEVKEETKGAVESEEDSNTLFGNE